MNWCRSLGYSNTVCVHSNIDFEEIFIFIHFRIGSYVNHYPINKGNNTITELRAILEWESQNS